jgi:hypothetical protein
MQIGRLGSLIGFAFQLIGAGVAVYYHDAGVALIIIGTIVLVASIVVWLYSNWQAILDWARRVGTAQIALLIGVAGTWVFMTLALGSLVWMVWAGKPVLGAAPKDEGPLIWFVNLTMEGGPSFGRNVFALTLHGANTSQREVRLKSAEIRSADKGTVLPLEIVAANETAGKNEVVPLDDVQLVPPGAPIDLVAKFNLPDGLSAPEFLATWSKFNLVVVDDTREYRVPFNEGNLAAFFPGLVGPRVTRKPEEPKQPKP